MEEQLEGGNGAGFEDGGRATSEGTQPASENWKTQGNRFSLEPWKGYNPAGALILTQQDLFQTSDLQKCQKINLSCLSH